MKRISNRKGRFISSKTTENIYGPKVVTPTNSANHYARKTPKEESSMIVAEGTSTEIKTMVEEVQTIVGTVDWNITDNPVTKPSSSTSKTSPTATNIKVWEGTMEVEGGRFDNLENNEPKTFVFPILDITKNVNMNNIPLSSLPHFNGMTSDDPDFYFYLIYCVDIIIIQIMLKN